MKWHIWLVGIILAVALLGWKIQFSREARAQAAYENAALGQSEAEIEARVGKPDEVLPCGDHLWWNGDQENPKPNNGQCVRWVRYNFFLHAVAFGYSADGKLVSRYHYQSE